MGDYLIYHLTPPPKYSLSGLGVEGCWCNLANLSSISEPFVSMVTHFERTPNEQPAVYTVISCYWSDSSTTVGGWGWGAGRTWLVADFPSTSMDWLAPIWVGGVLTAGTVFHRVTQIGGQAIKQTGHLTFM